MLLYLSVPVVLILVLSGAMAYFNSREGGAGDAAETVDE
jgi:hypothetical protein